MKKASVFVLLISLILMFASLISWIMSQPTFAIIASNLGLLILAISYLWENRNNFLK